MHDFVEAVAASLMAKNYYAALVGALVLPDICGKLADPDAGSRKRYEAWVERYLTPTYSIRGSEPDDDGIVRPKHVFLTGGDCYALRCAVLHEGVDATAEHRAAIALTRFRFVLPSTSGGTMHCNQSGSVLQLQVDLFCTDIIAAVEMWLFDVAERVVIQERLANLMQIFPNPIDGGLLVF